MKKSKKNSGLLQSSIREINGIRLVILASVVFMALDLVLVYTSSISLWNLFFVIPIISIIRIQLNRYMIARSVRNFKKYLLDPKFRKKYDLRNPKKKKV